MLVSVTHGDRRVEVLPVSVRVPMYWDDSENFMYVYHAIWTYLPLLRLTLAGLRLLIVFHPNFISHPQNPVRLIPAIHALPVHLRSRLLVLSHPMATWTQDVMWSQVSGLVSTTELHPQLIYSSAVSSRYIIDSGHTCLPSPPWLNTFEVRVGTNYKKYGRWITLPYVGFVVLYSSGVRSGDL